MTAGPRPDLCAGCAELHNRERHTWARKPWKRSVAKTKLWSWIAQIVAMLSLVVARIAVISYLPRILDRANRPGYKLLYFVGAIPGAMNYR